MPSNATPRESAIAGSMLGQAIGFLTDLGLTDDEIKEQCAETLAMIRAALASPRTMAAVDALKVRLEGS